MKHACNSISFPYKRKCRNACWTLPSIGRPDETRPGKDPSTNCYTADRRLKWDSRKMMAMRKIDRELSDRSTLVAFIVMVITTGGNVVAIKYVLREPGVDPLWAAATRFLLAAVIFAVIARVLHAAMPHGLALLGAMLYGALTFGGFFGLVYWGLLEALGLRRHDGPIGRGPS